MAFSALPPVPAAAGAATINSAHTGTVAWSSGTVTVGALLVARLYVDTAAVLPGFSITGPTGDWQLAGESRGAHGGMAVFIRTATAADAASPTYTATGPDGTQLFAGGAVGPSSLVVLLDAWEQTSGLGGPVVFTDGEGSEAVTGQLASNAPAARLLLTFASSYGLGTGGTAAFSTPDPADGLVRRNFAYINRIGADCWEAAPGRGETDAYTAPHSHPYAWMAAALLVQPALIPGPPPDSPAGLGTAHFSPGAFQPTPVLTIGSVDIPAAPGDIVRPVALEGFTVRWGRDRYLEQMATPTGTVQVWFASRGRAAVFAANDALPGQVVALSWQGTLPGESTVTREAFFKGRVATARVLASTARLGGEFYDGALVELTLTSVLADLGNITPRETWPEEAMGDRLARVQSYAAAYVTIELRDYWEPAHVAPIEWTSQQTTLDHVEALYDSCGADRMAYHPEDNRLYPVLRRNYAGLRGLAGLFADPADDTDGAGRAGRGAYLATLPVWPASGTDDLVNTPTYLDGAALAYDPAADGLSLGPDNRITRAELTHPDGEADTDPPESLAASLILARFESGLPIFEDWTWTGYPAVVGTYNGVLGDAYEAAGGDFNDTESIKGWLSAYLSAHPLGTLYASRIVVELVPGINEVTHGVRTVTISSQVVWREWAEAAAEALRDMCAQEGQEFTLAPVTWTTRKTGGFETVEQVRLLLGAAESQDLVFLQRTVLPEFGIRPIVGVMGGDIGYTDGGWDLTFTFAPVAPPDVPQHAIGWEDIGDDLTWQDTANHPDGMHESVTYEDMRFCARGLGDTTIPADTGWDT